MHLPRAKNTVVANLQQIDAPEGWCSFVLQANYPVPEDTRHDYQFVVDFLQRTISDKDPRFTLETFLQFDRFSPQNDLPVFQAGAKQWLPEIGLGVWPHRDSPKLWSNEEFLDSAHGELRPLMHHLFRIQPNKDALASAWKAFLGSGTLLRISVSDSNEFYQKTMEYYRPLIVEPALTSFPFYGPLLDGTGISSATETELSSWLCGEGSYLRESAEDGGMLFLVRTSPDIYFEDLAQSKESSIRWNVIRTASDGSPRLLER